MYEADRLINGLNILKIYKPNMRVMGVNKSYTSIEAQDEEFDSISDRDIEELKRLGWRQRTSMYWEFKSNEGLIAEQDI